MVRLFAVCLVVAMLLPSPGFADLCGALARCCAQNHGGYCCDEYRIHCGGGGPQKPFHSSICCKQYGRWYCPCPKAD